MGAASGEQLAGCEDAEVVLTSERTAIRRRGGVVLRPAGPWTGAVHALLGHLQSVGFERAPRVVGSGVDERGFEVLTYIEGELVHPGPWGDEALAAVGRMLHRLHDAAAAFQPPAGAVWQPWFLRELGGAATVISHGGVTPWNTVTQGGMPVALIDWEYAGPVDPLVELARVCWLFPQLHDDDVAAMVGLPSLEVRARQLRRLVDAYGLPPCQRRALVDRMVEVAVRETAEEAIEAQVRPDSQGPLWGLAWRARAAAWMQRHRKALEQALA